jgi:hypothetical protein
VVKRFREPAPNQVAILRAFEEEGWPARIDDPLFGGLNGAQAKQRLHDAIKRLNASQLHQRIRFHGDGTGTGIWWELA